MRRATPLLTLGFLFVLTAGAQVTGYYRQPDIHADLIVFNSEGDLWTVSRHGGSAQRLTSHPGQESWPTISPDGSKIAFSASYEGSADTYVMSIGGGTPKRITWIGGRPVGWSPNREVWLQAAIVRSTEV